MAWEIELGVPLGPLLHKAEASFLGKEMEQEAARWQSSGLK